MYDRTKLPYSCTSDSPESNLNEQFTETSDKLGIRGPYLLSKDIGLLCLVADNSKRWTHVSKLFLRTSIPFHDITSTD